MTAIHVEWDERSLHALHAALIAEMGGKRFRTDCADEIQHALAPAVPMLKASLAGMPASGQAHEGEPLRQAVARRIEVRVRLYGKASGAYVIVRKLGMPRGFANAPKRLNQSGWYHPNFGRGRVRQVGRPDWFGRPLEARQPAYRAAVVNAMQAMKRRIERRG